MAIQIGRTLWISTKLTRMEKSQPGDDSTRLKIALITSGMTPRDLPPGLYSLPSVYVYGSVHSAAHRMHHMGCLCRGLRRATAMHAHGGT
jgi:hypothetical protein